MNQEMSREVGFLNLLVSPLFIEKLIFSVFASFKVNFLNFLKQTSENIAKDATCTLYQLFKQRK